ncbi:unnamed protein product [Soboliphyme baturini]|uniref:PDZ domain-containing protein n=1 Tax=Soboliphyme baturini TaxID=241478 RepID=A0A3P8DWX4_9BILA|nr:unnamed protein product [Soboliphyme baturini]
MGSYVVEHKDTDERERITFIDYVDLYGPAFLAGLRTDVILSVNGTSVTDWSHDELVSQISQCSTLRMVLLYENYVRKIELCCRAIKLQVKFYIYFKCVISCFLRLVVFGLLLQNNERGCARVDASLSIFTANVTLTHSAAIAL